MPFYAQKGGNVKSVFLFIITSILSTFAYAKVDWSKYDHIDPQNLVADVPLKRAIEYYDMYQEKLKNKKYMTVIDYTKHNSRKRMYVINMQSGAVEPMLVAHGRGSDPSHTGYAKKFSNTEGSKMTSLGFFITSGTYQGDNGYSMYLDGISPSNSNARKRAIVVHGADYVSDTNVKQYGVIGRSYGCPALDRKLSKRVIDLIKGGSVIYSYGGQ